MHCLVFLSLLHIGGLKFIILNKINMKRNIAIGSIGIILVIVLASFSSVASVQTTKSNDMKSNIFQQIREKIIKSSFDPGALLKIIYLFISLLIYSFLHPYPD